MTKNIFPIYGAQLTGVWSGEKKLRAGPCLCVGPALARSNADGKLDWLDTTFKERRAAETIVRKVAPSSVCVVASWTLTRGSSRRT
jgi:hypothetical protein